MIRAVIGLALALIVLDPLVIAASARTDPPSSFRFIESECPSLLVLPEGDLLHLEDPPGGLGPRDAGSGVGGGGGGGGGGETTTCACWELHADAPYYVVKGMQECDGVPPNCAPLRSCNIGGCLEVPDIDADNDGVQWFEDPDEDPFHGDPLLGDFDQDGVINAFDLTPIGDPGSLPPFEDPDGDGIPSIYDPTPLGGDVPKVNVFAPLPPSITGGEFRSLLAALGLDAANLPHSLVFTPESLPDINGDGILTFREALVGYGQLAKAGFEALQSASIGNHANENGEITGQMTVLVSFAAAMSIVASAASAFDPDLYQAIALFRELENVVASTGVKVFGVTVSVIGTEWALTLHGQTRYTLEFVPHPDGSQGHAWVAYDEHGVPVDPEGLLSGSPFQLVVESIESAAGDPVDVASGELQHSAVDLRIPGRGIDLVLERHYRSRSIHKGILGHNWTMPLLDTHLQILPGARVILVDWGDGRQGIYAYVESERLYMAVGGDWSKLALGHELDDADAANDPPGLVIREPDGTLWHFCKPAWFGGTGAVLTSQLRKVSDSHGNAIILRRDEHGKVEEIVDTLGRSVSFLYDADTHRLIEIEDWSGRKVNYDYDDKDDLVEVLGPEVPHMTEQGTLESSRTVHRYQYHEHPDGWEENQDAQLNHNLATVWEGDDPDPLLAIDYWEVPGYQLDKVRATVSRGRVTQYRYYPVGESAPAGVDPYEPSINHTTEVLSHEGRLQRFRVADGKLMRHETVNGFHDAEFSFLGGTYEEPASGVVHGKWMTVYSYDSENRLVQTLETTDLLHPDGRRTVYSYDALNPDHFQRGNARTITEYPWPPVAETPQRVTNIQYDPVTGAPVRVTDPIGRTIERIFAHHERPYDDVRDDLPRWGIFRVNPPEEILDLFGRGDVNGDGLQAGVYLPVAFLGPETGIAPTGGPNGTYATARPERLSRFDAMGRPVGIRDARGMWTVIEYTDGLLSRLVEDPGGIDRVTSYTHDDLGRPVRENRPGGEALGVVYDARDLPIQVRLLPKTNVLPTGGGMMAAMGGGELIGIWAAEPIVQDLFYDLGGRFTASSSKRYGGTSYPSAGSVPRVSTLVRHDSGGSPFSWERRVYGEQGVLIDTRSWSQDADSWEKPITRTLPRGGTLAFEHDSRGQPLAVQRELATGVDAGTTRWDWGPFGDLTRITNGEGESRLLVVDGYSRVREVHEPNGLVYSIEYDAADRVHRANATSNGSEVYLLETDHDALDRVVESRSRNYRVASDGTVSVGTPGWLVTRYGYGLEPGELLWRSRDPDGINEIERYEYDALLRRVATWHGPSDAVGVVDQLDRAGRVLTRTRRYDGLGSAGPVSPSEATWSYEHDRHGRVRAIHDPAGGTIAFEYSPEGSIAKATDQLGRVIRTTYDSLGTPIRVVESEHSSGGASRTTSFEHDAESLRIAVVDPSGNRTEYEYDGLSRLAIRRYATQAEESFEYDKSDRIKRHVLPDQGTITFGYGASGFLETIGAIGGGPRVARAFTHDALGRVLSISEQVGTDPAVVVHRSFDARDLLLEDRQVLAGTARAMQAVFDPAGRLKQLSWPSSRSLTREYDTHGRLARILSSAHGEVLRILSPYGLGAFLSADLRGSAVWEKDFDGTGRQTRSEVRTDVGLALCGESYEYDLAGNILARTASTSGVRDEYDVDVFHRLVEWRHGVQGQGKAARTVRWEWTASDGLLSQADSSGPSVSATPNVLNQETALAPELASLDWNARGAETARTGPAGTWTRAWDALGRLRTSQHPSGAGVVTLTWRWDGLDRLVERSDAERGNVRYSWWGSAVLQTESAAYGTNEYLPGPDGRTPLFRHGFGGPAWVYADAVGNAAALHDGSAVLEAFSYEPFGRVWDPVGGAAVWQSAYGHELLFQSSPHDLRHGLVRLGARDLDTRIGRFLSRDPLREAGGWNLYSYARANPLRWHDQSGLSPEQNQMPGGPLTGRPTQFAWITDLLDYLEQSVGQYEWRHGDVFGGKGFWDLSTGDKIAVLSLAEERLMPEGWESREQQKALRNTRDWLMRGRQAFEGIELAEQADWVLSFPERLTAEGLGGVGLDPLTARTSSEIGWALYGALKKPVQEGLAGARKGVSEWIKRKILRKGKKLAEDAAARGGGRAVDAATPIGRRGNPMNVPRGTNAPTTIGGREFSGHALDQMQGRGIMPSVVENAIQNGVRTAGSEAGTFQHVFEGVRVITNEAGRVITVIPR